ncbi:acyltransferase family protein [Pseudomonas nitroreducens]|uniref:acyltransferase family protein n=1 Tax=Pseudomonas nitroreducens TaxID=46680 RepID=UPI0020A021F7|nr:acyltransferase [Pseudomonas nitroreducens]MCP1621390.1 peptidoglycan/LPS O-acetylase OafA/YrhL [Pseudomonas nitroreducens]
MVKRPSYLSIQALRGLAAVLVVVYHLRTVEGKFGAGETWIPGWLNLGYAGVDLFFVISGFVMATIARGRYGSVSGAIHFLRKRAWRVLPPYWLYTTVVVAVITIAPHTVSASFQNQSVLASYLLWPQTTPPVLIVGWTLVYEAYFYLVMAVAIAFLPERLLPIFLMLWAAIVAMGWTVLDMASPVMSTVFSPMSWEFIAGACVALYWHRIPAAWGLPLLLTGVCLFVGAMPVLDHLKWLLDGNMYRVPIFGVAGTLIVAGAVAWETSHRPSIPAWILSVGDSSYSLYLSHIFVISALGRLWRMTPFNVEPWQHVGFVVLTLLACVVVGLASYRWFERPLLAYGENRMNGLAVKTANAG